MNIEGKNAVREAINSGTTINKLLIDKNYSGRRDEIQYLASKNKIQVEFLPKNILDKKSETKHHQGYIALATSFCYSTLEELLNEPKLRAEKPFFVLLDGVEDPHNLGAIIRSCECAGVHGIVIPKNRSASVNETVIRTSAGAAANMKIAKVTNLKEAIDLFKQNDIWVFAAEAGGENVYAKNLDIPLAIIIGSEGFGVRPSIKEAADGIISVKLKGKVNSLNASVATGVLVFEVLRQRESK